MRLRARRQVNKSIGFIGFIRVIRIVRIVKLMKIRLKPISLLLKSKVSMLGLLFSASASA